MGTQLEKAAAEEGSNLLPLTCLVLSPNSAAVCEWMIPNCNQTLYSCKKPASFHSTDQVTGEWTHAAACLHQSLGNYISSHVGNQARVSKVALWSGKTHTGIFKRSASKFVLEIKNITQILFAKKGWTTWSRRCLPAWFPTILWFFRDLIKTRENLLIAILNTEQLC